MKPLLAFGLLVLTLPSPAPASVASAWQAREELGDVAWVEVVQIKNDNSRSRFPAAVYATLFEFDGVLWFYNEQDGTQSLSRYRGLLNADKADPLSLLQGIERGFSEMQVLADESRPKLTAHERLPNGCFIDSISALREIARRETVRRASLLSYYIEGNGRRRGHTILIYETSAGPFALDSAAMSRPVRLADADLDGEALRVARQLSLVVPVAARWLPVSVDSRNTHEVARAPGHLAGLPATGANLTPACDSL